jgi:predicted small metal-binding protein
MNKHQTDLINSIDFANEFMKVVRGFKVEHDRPDGLPQDVKEHLANEHLNTLIKERDLEPEMLIWGMLHMIEILLKYCDLTPEDLSAVMDKFVEHIKENPQMYRDKESND